MIAVEHLTKRFGKNLVLDDISETIEQGEKVVIIGPSGSGKSTFLRCMNLLETPTSGTISFEGTVINDRKTDINAIRRQMGMVFQHFNLFPNMSVIDNITLAPVELKKMSKEEAQEAALHYLDIVGLKEKANVNPRTLSGGQKQRGALARAMMIDPEIIGYDEPTSALDPELRLEVEKLILQNRELGMTQIVVTHDLQFAENIADQILKVEPK